MSPEDMYKSAMAKNPDILSNTYVEDLSAQIDTLKELISSRQINSSNIIDEYQSKIDDLVLKSSKINNDLKQEYKTESDKIAKLQREANKNNSLSFLFKPVFGAAIMMWILPMLVNIIEDYFKSYANII